MVSGSVALHQQLYRLLQEWGVLGPHRHHAMTQQDAYTLHKGEKDRKIEMQLEYELTDKLDNQYVNMFVIKTFCFAFFSGFCSNSKPYCLQGFVIKLPAYCIWHNRPNYTS